MSVVDWTERESDLVARYEDMKPLLREWGSTVDAKLGELVQEVGALAGKTQIWPRHRVKENHSLIGRALYSPTKMQRSDPLQAVEDKVGTRVVLTSNIDIPPLQLAILEHQELWDARISRSSTKYLISPKVFDYKAVHLNLTPSTNCLLFKGISTKKRKLYVCEVQLRTLLQHAFAEVAHDTIYKGAFGSDSQLVRILSRGQALMEVTDEQFEVAYDKMNDNNTFENALLAELKKFGTEHISGEMFKTGYDARFNATIFETYDVASIEFETLRRSLTQNVEDLQKLIAVLPKFLVDQPSFLLLYYLVGKNSGKVEELWSMDPDIIRSLYYYMGIALKYFVAG